MRSGSRPASTASSSTRARNSSTALRSRTLLHGDGSKLCVDPSAKLVDRSEIGLTPSQHRQLLDPGPQLIHRTQIRLLHGDGSKLVDPSAKLVDRSEIGLTPSQHRQSSSSTRAPQLLDRAHVGSRAASASTASTRA